MINRVGATSLEVWNSFAEDAYLNKQFDPWVVRREPSIYGNFIITNCQHKDWWYAKYVGVEFFGEIRFCTHWERLTGEKRIDRVIVTMLLNSRKHTGRCIDWKDVYLV